MRKVLLFNIGFTFIGFVVLELVFGGWVTSKRINQINVMRHVDYRLNVSKLYPSAESLIRYKRDLYGLRGHYSDPAKIDILTIGGSGTDQRYLGEGKTWQDVLQSAFARRGVSITVVNAGLDGQSTIGNIKNFSYWFPEIPNMRAKYVLVYVGVNDFFVKDSLANDDLAGTQTLKSVIKSKSALYRLYCNITGIYLASFAFPIRHRSINFSMLKWTSAPLQADYSILMTERIAHYEQRLRILNKRIREFGANPIFVTQPMRMYKFHQGKLVGVAEPLYYDGVKINGVDCYRMMKLLHQKTLAVSKNVSALAVDLARELDFNDQDFYDYIHNTPDGAEKIGNYLYQELKTLFH